MLAHVQKVRGDKHLAPEKATSFVSVTAIGVREQSCGSPFGGCHTFADPERAEKGVGVFIAKQKAVMVSPNEGCWR